MSEAMTMKRVLALYRPGTPSPSPSLIISEESSYENFEHNEKSRHKRHHRRAPRHAHHGIRWWSHGSGLNLSYECRTWSKAKQGSDDHLDSLLTHVHSGAWNAAGCPDQVHDIERA